MRVLPHSIFVIALACLGIVPPLQAQQPSSSPAAGGKKNLISNSSFENTFRRNDPWSGLNQQGFVQGLTGQLPVLTQGGRIGNTPMPVSVGVADMNGDGLLDLITSDVVGYLRVYFNKGTAQEPKFDDGELIPVFLTRSPAHSANEQIRFRFQGQRIDVGNFTKSGRNDILIGNYIGEVLWLRNEGSPSAPNFRPPKARKDVLIPTTQETTRRWGNVFAPAVWDWNGDGRFDILIGEGSYSANNIHLLLNKGSNTGPKFDESGRHVLAFGDGREQLDVTVVDYNNDGKMDLLVSDRQGKIGVYLNTSPQWKPGDEIKFSSFITVQGQAGRDLSGGGITSITTGDLNGDKLFDLILGKANGRVAVAYNRGTPTEPKFDAPVELKGDSGSPAILIPSAWNLDFGLSRGNFYGYIRAVMDETAFDEELAKKFPNAETDPNQKERMAQEKAANQPSLEKGLGTPAGSKVLKFGYFPNPNQIIRTPLEYSGALTPDWRFTAGGNWNNTAPANYFRISDEGSFRLTPGKTYVLTFKTKGKNVQNARVQIWYGASKVLAEGTVVREGDRRDAQVVKGRQEIREHRGVDVDFKPGSSWTTVTREFKPEFNDKRLNDVTAGANFAIGTLLTPQSGELYIDDIQLVEK